MPAGENAFKARWRRTCRELGIDVEDADAAWPQIETAYSDKDRHYHSLEHLGHMFDTLETLRPSHGPVLSLAVWFHDLIYDVTRNDNEAESAREAGVFARRFALASEDVERLEGLILSTRTHVALSDDPDCHAMLDADLAVLAADAETYDRYARNIRGEYARYPDALYNTGRAGVLERFLARPCLYFSPSIRDDWDRRARINLTRELERLSG